MSVVAVDDGAHSELGPSAAERWLNCAASVAACRGVAEKPSIYAIEGTVAHTVSEWVRLRGVPAKTFIGTTVRIGKGDEHTDVTIDAAFAESVQTFCDKVAEAPGHELVEARVAYEQFVPGGFGTLDSAKMTLGLGRVTDFKHGTGIRKWARKNPQLMLYALGILIEWDYLFGFEKFVLAISQPRLGHYDEWTISREALLEWAHTTLTEGAKRTFDKNAPFRAGAWCKDGFCKIRKTCLERARYETASALDGFDDII